MIFQRNDRRIPTVCFIFAFFFVLVQFTPAQDAAYLSFSPAVSLPVGESAGLYSFGVGGGIAGHLPLGFVGLEATANLDYQGNFLQAGAGYMNLVRAGGGVGWPFLKNDFMSLWAWTRVGAFLALYSDSPPLFDLWISAGLRADFTVARGLFLSVEPSYDQLVALRSGALSSFYSGIGLGIRVGIQPGKLASGTRTPKMRILPPEFGSVFPVAYKYYDTHPIGSVRIVNQESSPVTGVKVEFFVPRYTEGAKLVVEIPQMEPKEEKTVPLTVLFNKDVLNITEIDKVQSQLTVRYTVGGTELSVQSNNTLQIFSRNNISWDDTRRAAAFVTANDPTVEKLSSNIVSGIAEMGGTALTSELRKGMALFTALKEYGLRYIVDPSSSYQVLSQDENTADYLQFPVQTLDYKKGDCDDLSILYCAMLHTVGNKAAFITVPGHIYVAFDLGMTRAEVKKIFSSVNDFIFRDDGVWLPVEITMLDRDFMQAWSEGAREWNVASERKTAELIPVLEAWKEYAPTWFGSTIQQDVINRAPKPETVSARYKDVAKKLIDRESTPLIKELKSRIASSSSPALVNRLGTVQAIYGMLAEAETAFKQAAASNYAPAIHNLGNLYFMKRDFTGALAKYSQAYKLSPGSLTIIMALARTRFELKQYTEAQKMYAIAESLDPEQAEKIAYVTADSASEGRASEAQSRLAVGWED